MKSLLPRLLSHPSTYPPPFPPSLPPLSSMGRTFLLSSRPPEEVEEGVGGWVGEGAIEEEEEEEEEDEEEEDEGLLGRCEADGAF